MTLPQFKIYLLIGFLSYVIFFVSITKLNSAANNILSNNSKPLPAVMLPDMLLSGKYNTNSATDLDWQQWQYRKGK